MKHLFNFELTDCHFKSRILQERIYLEHNAKKSMILYFGSYTEKCGEENPHFSV
jgi:hypothetical protein